MNSNRDRYYTTSGEEVAGTSSLQRSQQNFSLNNSDNSCDNNNHLMINYSIPVPGSSNGYYTNSDGNSLITPAAPLYDSHSGSNNNYVIGNINGYDEEVAGPSSLQRSQQNFSQNNYSDSCDNNNNHLMINYSIPVPGSSNGYYTNSDGNYLIIPAAPLYDSHSGSNNNYVIGSSDGYYTNSDGNSFIIPAAPLYNSHSGSNNDYVIGNSTGYDEVQAGTSLQEPQLPQPVRSYVIGNSNGYNEVQAGTSLQEPQLPQPVSSYVIGNSNGYDEVQAGTSLQESQLPQPVVVIRNSTNIKASSRDKAANFHALNIKIGKWERYAIRKDGITVKIYYKKKKLAWEILESNLSKNKIEIQWSNIRDIRRTTDGDGCGILEIELNTQPAFYKEKDLKPRMHATWESTSDFTGGEACMFRIHMLRFASGVLDKYYHRLLESLPELRRMPLNSNNSLNFPFHHNSTGQQLDMRSAPAYLSFNQPQCLQGSMASPPPPPYNLQFPSQSQFSSVEESIGPVTTIPPSFMNSTPTIPGRNFNAFPYLSQESNPEPLLREDEPPPLNNTPLVTIPANNQVLENQNMMFHGQTLHFNTTGYIF